MNYLGWSFCRGIAFLLATGCGDSAGTQQSQSNGGHAGTTGGLSAGRQSAALNQGGRQSNEGGSSAGNSGGGQTTRGGGLNSGGGGLNSGGGGLNSGGGGLNSGGEGLNSGGGGLNSGGGGLTNGGLASAGRNSGGQPGGRTASGGAAGRSGGNGGRIAGAGGSGASAGTAGGGPVRPSGCPDTGLDAANIRYVCDCQAGADANCVPGNDTAAGTIAAPWQTYAHAATQFRETLQAGDTIAFCRGGSFDISGDRKWVNTGCRANLPCVIRDYVPPWGQAGLPVPILTADGGDGFAFTDDGDATHDEGYIVLNLDIRSTTNTDDGFFIYNDVDDILVCGVSIDGFQFGFHPAGSNAPAEGSDGRNQRIVLQNSRITNNSGQGWLGFCDDCGVAYSYFENNGFGTAVSNHNIYFSGTELVTGMFAIGNELYHSAIISGQCTGASLVGHGQLDDLRIEDNLIREDIDGADGGCWGIAIDTGYSNTLDSFHRASIRGNTVTNVGNVGIGISGCADCTIENNVVVQQQTGFDSILIAVPDRPRESGDLPATRVIVRNNTLLADTSADVLGIQLNDEGTDHLVVSNAFLSKGSGTTDCFAYNLPYSAYSARDNNICYAVAGTNNWVTGSNLAAWQTSSGADMNSLVADPLLMSTEVPFDFTPANGSPLIGKGHANSSTVDITGKARDANPDVGAVEK